MNNRLTIKVYSIFIIIIITVFILLFFFNAYIPNNLTNRQAEVLCKQIIQTKINNDFKSISASSKQAMFQTKITVFIKASSNDNEIANGYCILSKKYTDNNIQLLAFQLRYKGNLYLFNNVLIKLVKEF